MIDGDPFQTAELDALRATQRRWLATVPSTYKEAVAAAYLPAELSSPLDDDPENEWALREAAQTETGQIKGFLTTCESWFAYAAVVRAVSRRVRTPDLGMRDKDLFKAERGDRDPSFEPPIEDAKRDALMRALVFMMLADEAATPPQPRP
jgi:hypothetical protein